MVTSFAQMRPAGVKVGKQDTQIEYGDQMNINEFSRCNMKYHDMKDDIKKLKEEIENLADAQQQVEEALGEEGALKLFLGEAFIAVDDDAAGQFIEKLQEEKQEELEKKQDALEVLENQMKNLKAKLYAKFGNSINLEEGE